MAETAALLVDDVLPRQPVRQWVLSLPFALRYLLATRPEVVTQHTRREGVLGTPAVLIGIAIAVVAQLAFTYLPLLQQVFETRPVGFSDGLLSAILSSASHSNQRQLVAVIGHHLRCGRGTLRDAPTRVVYRQAGNADLG